MYKADQAVPLSYTNHTIDTPKPPPHTHTLTPSCQTSLASSCHMVNRTLFLHILHSKSLLPRGAQSYLLQL